MYTIEPISQHTAHAHLTPAGVRVSGLHAGLYRPMPMKTPAILCLWSKAIHATGYPVVLWYRAGIMVASWDAETGFEPLMRMARDPGERLRRIQEQAEIVRREREEDRAHRAAMRQLTHECDREDLAAIRAQRRTAAMLRAQEAKERARERYQAAKAALAAAREAGTEVDPPKPRGRPRKAPEPLHAPAVNLAAELAWIEAEDSPPDDPNLLTAEEYVALSPAEREAYDKRTPTDSDRERREEAQRRADDAKRHAEWAAQREARNAHVPASKRAKDFETWRREQVAAGALPTDLPPLPEGVVPTIRSLPLGTLDGT